MEEKKEPVKISMSTFFLILAIIVIAVMVYFMYAQKTSADKQIAELENDVASMQSTIDDLQGKLDAISEVANTENKDNYNNNSQSTIEGIYESDYEYESIVFDFSRGTVKYEELYKAEGTYVVNGDTIEITYNKSFEDPDGKIINDYSPRGDKEKLTIENKSTITDENGMKYMKK